MPGTEPEAVEKKFSSLFVPSAQQKGMVINMSYLTFFGIVLFSILNFEKGRVKSTGIWSKKYVLSLFISINKAKHIVSLLKNGSFSNNDLTIIKKYAQDYINANIELYFPITKETKHITCLNNNQKDILSFIECLLNEIQLQVEKREKNYKVNTSYLLRAIHNFPRCFVEETEINKYNVPIHSLSYTDAIEIAQSYLSLINFNLNILDKKE